MQESKTAALKNGTVFRDTFLGVRRPWRVKAAHGIDGPYRRKADAVAMARAFYGTAYDTLGRVISMPADYKVGSVQFTMKG